MYDEPWRIDVNCVDNPIVGCCGTTPTISLVGESQSVALGGRGAGRSRESGVRQVLTNCGIMVGESDPAVLSSRERGCLG